MIIIDLNHEPASPSTSADLGWANTSTGTIAVPPAIALRARVRRAVRRLRQAFIPIVVRLGSAMLNLSWRLEVTVDVYAEVITDDPAIATAALRRFLYDAATRVVLDTPDQGPTGWRRLASAPVEQIRAIVAEPAGLNDPPTTWDVSALATVRVLVAARDAFGIEVYSDVEPVATPRPIRLMAAGNDRIRRTPVRSQHLR